jgi:hypothetical protein
LPFVVAIQNGSGVLRWSCIYRICIYFPYSILLHAFMVWDSGLYTHWTGMAYFGSVRNRNGKFTWPGNGGSLFGVQGLHPHGPGEAVFQRRLNVATREDFVLPGSLECVLE